MEQWTPTPAALALLKKIEDRKEAEKGIAVARRMTEEKQRRERQADENERKYGEQLTYADRMMEARDDATRIRYTSIEAMAGNNGGCTTLKGTWRRLKFGKGNIGKKGFEKLGFKENED